AQQSVARLSERRIRRRAVHRPEIGALDEERDVLIVAEGEARAVLAVVLPAGRAAAVTGGDQVRFDRLQGVEGGWSAAVAIQLELDLVLVGAVGEGDVTVGPQRLTGGADDLAEVGVRAVVR